MEEEKVLTQDIEVEEQFIEPIPIDIEEVVFTPLDAEQFQQGVKDISYICGMVSALHSTGVSEDFILNYILNKETVEYNLAAGIENNKTSLEIAKIQRVNIEKEML